MRVDPADPRLAAALGVQRLGLMVAIAGAILALVRALWLPAMPKLAPAGVIALAVGLVGLGIVRRLRVYAGRR